MKLSARNPEHNLISIILIFFSAAVGILQTSCGKEPEKKLPSPNITWEKLPAEATVEVARTVDERKTGLMYREYLQKDSGMYFIMEREEVQSFWMKDTRIPLSIAYINSDNVIISIKEMRPYNTRGTSSERPAKFALEMDKGWFSENNISVGDKAALKDSKVLFYLAISD